MILHETVRLVSECAGPAFHTLTETVRQIVDRSGVKSGVCVVYSRHTTCAVIIDEDSIDVSYSGLSYLQQDLADMFENIIPTCRREGQYLHPGPLMVEFAAGRGESRPQTLNTDAHLRSSVLGRSESIPIIDGRLELGEYGHIYFIDFDRTRPRERSVIVSVIGE